jgi:small conductance mechanosensitive channel
VALASLIELAEAEPRVMADPAPWAKVTATADSAVQVTLRCWVDPEDWMDTRFDLIKQVKETFEARGLSFPYPHQVAMERAPQSAQRFRRQA